MSKKLKIEEVVKKFRDVHGDTYDYSKFHYTNIDTKSTIICKNHGEFLMSAYKHITRKQGCKECSKTIRKTNSLLNEEYIKRCNIIHNNKYDYSNTNYINSKTNINIICPIHGEFIQNARTHIKGSGCSDCVDYRNIKHPQDLINILSKDYEYPNINEEFKYLTSKISVYCKKHKIINKVNIQKLLHKQSYCRECTKEKAIYSGYKLSNWIKYCKNKGVDRAYVYLIKCYNENELFYKIGLTSDKDITKRYNSPFLMPYTYDIIDIIELTCSDAYSKEKELLRLNKTKENRYKPLIDFRGKYETFKNIIIWN